jgi:hypothetical protein
VFNIYRQAFELVRQGWIAFIAFAALLVALPLIMPSKSGGTGGLFVGFALFAYMLHRNLLFGDPIDGFAKAKSAHPPTTWRFVWVSAVMVIVPFAIAGFTFYKLGFGAAGMPKERFVFVLSLIGLPIYWLFLATFGTALPAAAAGDAFGPRAALRRTRKTFLPILLGLLIGPVLFSVISFAAQLTLIAWTDLPPDIDESGVIHPVGVGFAIVQQVMGFFATALAIVVLCQAYRRVVPADISQTPVKGI